MLIPAYLLATSERHIHGKFVAAGPARYRSRYLAAVVVNALMIAAYFTGRTVGVVDRVWPRGGENGRSASPSDSVRDDDSRQSFQPQ